MRIGTKPGEDEERDPGRPEARVQAPEDVRHLAVVGHRVRDPRRADHARVRRDEEDRRREDADVDLERLENRPASPRFSTTPSTGSFAKPPSSGGSAEQRLVLPAARARPAGPRARRREGEVDREDSDRDEPDRAPGCFAPGRAPPRRGSRRSRFPCTRASRPGSRARSCPTSARLPSRRSRRRISGLKTSTNPSRTRSAWVAKSITARAMLSRAASRIPTMFSATRTTITPIADDHVPRVRPERLPEDRQVVRDEERRDGDRDHVVEELRPGRCERHDLVERVAREARGPACLGVAHGPLGVRRGRGREDRLRR